MDSISLVDSVTLQDSASQAGHALPLEGQIASFVAHGSLLQSMHSEMISSQVTECLNNFASLPASSLSLAEHLASFRPTSLKSTVPSRVQKALPAKGTWGGSLGHEPLFGWLSIPYVWTPRHS